MPREHQFEYAASAIADWLDQMSTKVVDGIKGGGRAPFAAPANNSERLAYYEQAFFNPDGTENVQGRMKEMHRIGLYGPDGFIATLAEVLKARQDRMLGEYRQNATLGG